jgi:hypothetical protein
MQGNRTRDPQNIFELSIPSFKYIRNEGPSKTILRCEDDDGQIVDIDRSLVDQKEKNKI